MSIPKNIVQTSREKPEQYVIDQISTKCSGWTYFHYNDEEAVYFLQQHYIEEFKDIVHKFCAMPSGAHRADLFRYYFLYLYGGVFMDSDAMIQTDINTIIKDYSFFSVLSNYKQNSIFQGFIGCTPQHPIIYEALKDAYSINPEILRSSYHLLCDNLYTIIVDRQFTMQNPTDMNIHLYKERVFNDLSYETYNENNESLLIHYWKFKTIPPL